MVVVLTLVRGNFLLVNVRMRETDVLFERAIVKVGLFATFNDALVLKPRLL